MRLKEIEQRLNAIKVELETRGAELTAEELEARETEVKELQEERKGLLDQQEKRSKLLATLAVGEEPIDISGNQVKTTVLRSFAATQNGVQGREERTVNPTDTVEYRTAFMNYICRGTAMPTELRTAENTTVADTGAVIPNTILQEIIVKLESYGNLYAGFRKLDVQGGVSIPIADIKPTAKWVGENSGEDQKLSANESVVFNYYGLEVKISQSILANVTTLERFQALFVPLGTEAIVKAIEIGALNGTGTEQMLGVTKDPRVKTVVALTDEEISSWAGWHKKVKAKIKKAYRTGVFIMNQSTFDGHIDGMVDANGQPVGRTNYGVNGEETYRFMGKTVETVEDDVLPSYDDAAEGDVVAVFMKLSDYVINSNMSMTATKWVDNDNNKVKNKLMMILDGKLADANGVIIIKKIRTA